MPPCARTPREGRRLARTGGHDCRRQPALAVPAARGRSLSPCGPLIIDREVEPTSQARGRRLQRRLDCGGGCSARRRAAHCDGGPLDARQRHLCSAVCVLLQGSNLCACIEPSASGCSLHPPLRLHPPLLCSLLTRRTLDSPSLPDWGGGEAPADALYRRVLPMLAKLQWSAAEAELSADGMLPRIGLDSSLARPRLMLSSRLRSLPCEQWWSTATHAT